MDPIFFCILGFVIIILANAKHVLFSVDKKDSIKTCLVIDIFAIVIFMVIILLK